VCHAQDPVSQSVDTGSPDGDSRTTKPEIKQDAHSASAIVDSNLVPSQPEVPAADWQPSDQDLLWGMDRYPTADLTAATERFVNRCRAKGYHYRDLGAAWRSWLADDQSKAAARSTARNGGNKSTAAQSRFDAWAGVAARYSGSTRHAA
jgi:hypothetical protein